MVSQHVSQTCLQAIVAGVLLDPEGWINRQGSIGADLYITCLAVILGSGKETCSIKIHWTEQGMDTECMKKKLKFEEGWQ